MFKQFILHDNKDEYSKYYHKVLNKTVYHEMGYLLAEEMAEDYPIHIFLYEENSGFVLYPSIIRRINDIALYQKYSKECWDLIAPHEFSGPLFNVEDENLIIKFYIELQKYCYNNNIIFHFCRLNPNSYLHSILMKTNLIVQYSNCHTWVNLLQESHEIFSEFQASTRRNIKRSMKSHLEFNIVRISEKHIDEFVELYHISMEFLGARKFLYFNREYFRKLLFEFDKAKMALVSNEEGKIVAASVILLDADIVYYHLGCFDRKYTLMRPMNYLIYSIILWSKEQGFKKLHLGGGGQSLKRFKEGFSKESIDYYVYYEIYNKEQYEDLVLLIKNEYPEKETIDYLPQYRCCELELQE